MLPLRPHAENVWHLFPVLVDDRDRVAARMREHGISVAVHYTRPVHLQPPFAEELGNSRLLKRGRLTNFHCRSFRE